MGEKYFQGSGQKYNDFLKTKKMRNVRTINLAVVSRRDLYYVSENKSFCFGQFFMGETYFQEFGPSFLTYLFLAWVLAGQAQKLKNIFRVIIFGELCSVMFWRNLECQI